MSQRLVERLLTGALVLALAGGGIAYVKNVSSARQDVRRLEDSVAAERARRAADSARAARLAREKRAAQVALKETRAWAEDEIARARSRLKELLANRDTALVAAEEADSAYRAAARELLEDVRPELRPRVQRLQELHLRTVQAKDAAIESLNLALATKDSVIGAKDSVISKLADAEAAADSAWRAERKVSASLRRENRLLQRQVARLNDALSITFFESIFQSPVTHATVAVAGGIGGYILRGNSDS